MLNPPLPTWPTNTSPVLVHVEPGPVTVTVLATPVAMLLNEITLFVLKTVPPLEIVRWPIPLSPICRSALLIQLDARTCDGHSPIAVAPPKIHWCY